MKAQQLPVHTRKIKRIFLVYIHSQLAYLALSILLLGGVMHRKCTSHLGKSEGF